MSILRLGPPWLGLKILKNYTVQEWNQTQERDLKQYPHGAGQLWRMPCFEGERECRPVNHRIGALQPWKAKDNWSRWVQLRHQERKRLGRAVSQLDRDIHRLMDKPGGRRLAI